MAGKPINALFKQKCQEMSRAKKRTEISGKKDIFLEHVELFKGDFSTSRFLVPISKAEI